MNAPLRTPAPPRDQELAAQIELRTARCLALFNASMMRPEDGEITEKLGDEMIELLKINQAALEVGALGRWQEGMHHGG